MSKEQYPWSCPPCPPPSPQPCPQVCPPPPPPAPCRVKPVMRRLHRQQTKINLATAITLSLTAGSCVYFFIGCPRKALYADYYRKAELDDMADEMARKGLFQAVPKGSLKDK